ncbi:hypothetical protein C8Q80DRAFT_1121392 [Daedaleopsis nitida]|nr:hypothetical protein C8Q80DRAFT_1121392 [Daedaleopsis nitida]
MLLSFTLVSSFFHGESLAHAATTGTADDTDVGMYYSGLWIPDGDPHTFGSHDTWTNQTGASMALDFIGTEIQVFATRRPEGTYITNVSFSVDGGPADLWTTTDFVPDITYRNLVYTSPSLSPTQHRIVITNLGQIFWLGYEQWTTADSPPDAGDDNDAGGGGGGGGKTIATSAPVQSPSPSPPAPSTADFCKTTPDISPEPL